MKREKARLEELRRMSYADYLLTPEWQETQKGALKKAGNRCQVCRAENVSLNTYHTTLDTIGCEQEGDVMTLCEACYDRLYQQLVGQEDATDEAEWETSPDFSFTKKAAVFGSSVAVTMGLPALLHAPLPAELFGLGAAIALAINSPKIYAEIRDSLPQPVVNLLDGRAERKRAREETHEWSNWDRLLGRHLHGNAPGPIQDEDDLAENDQAQPKEAKVPLAVETPERDVSGAHPPSAIPRQFVLSGSTLEAVKDVNKRRFVYFGRTATRQVVMSVDDMYHVIDVASSGKGKSNRFRLAMMQVVSQCETYFINPLANNVKAVNDSRKIEVWKPIFDRLANKRPVKDGPGILGLMTALVNETEHRNSQENEGDFSWREKPIFVFIDELPEVFARCPEAVTLLDKIGRTGRQFCIFTWVASQTAAVKDIGQSTAAQANYKTRIYGGGDRNSSGRMMKGSIPMEQEQALQSNGAGLTLMLADGFSDTEFVRAPLVTNEALFAYFGLPPFNMEDWLAPRTMSRQPSQHLQEPNLTVERTPPIYRQTPSENAEMPVYSPVNAAVNGSTSGMTASSQSTHLHLLKTAVNEDAEHETTESPAVNVNAETRDVMKRLHDQGIKHNVIAKAVRLDGRRYDIYKQVCREMGIEKEA